MKLTVFNGSPKQGINNTEVLLNKFIEGFMKSTGNEVEVIRMNNEKTYKESVKYFEKAETVLIAFPLYVYSMPAGVKTFFEELGLRAERCRGKKLGFLVQYGFIEAIHARPLEKYLEQLSNELKCDYLGTIIKGGCDSLAKYPPGSKKILKGAYEIGKAFGIEKKFDKGMLDAYSKPEVQKEKSVFIMNILVKIINKIYWQASLKKNGVSRQESFAKPYGN